MKESKRLLSEMASMYGLPEELYTMHRGVTYSDDHKLRYDITEIPPYKINGQYNKTKGHIHTSGHEELYIVLEGSAYFLFLSKDLKDFYYTQATKGESVIVPHDYHHVTINAGNYHLKLGNWISEDCTVDYAPMEKKNGMCYYLGKEWSKNPKYKEVPKLKAKPPILIRSLPTNLDFLCIKN